MSTSFVIDVEKGMGVHSVAVFSVSSICLLFQRIGKIRGAWDLDKQQYTAMTEGCKPRKDTEGVSPASPNP